jgi:acyl-coenzyme A synthetase/AMP-(fatty) acid ligase
LDELRKNKFRPPRELRLISSTGSVLSGDTADYFHSVLPGTKLVSGSGGLFFFFFLFACFFFLSLLGTELNGGLACGNPLSPTYGGGELSGPVLGMDVDVVDPIVRFFVLVFFFFFFFFFLSY